MEDFFVYLWFGSGFLGIVLNLYIEDWGVNLLGYGGEGFCYVFGLFKFYLRFLDFCMILGVVWSLVMIDIIFSLVELEK